MESKEIYTLTKGMSTEFRARLELVWHVMDIGDKC